jgi:hypothetical protein
VFLPPEKKRFDIFLICKLFSPFPQQKIAVVIHGVPTAVEMKEQLTLIPMHRTLIHKL